MMGPGQDRHQRVSFEPRQESQTVSRMQIFDFPDIPALLNGVEIELVPRCQGSKLWTRDVSQRAEEDSTDDRVNGIRKLQSNQAEHDICPGEHG